MDQQSNSPAPYQTRFFDVITIPAPVPPLSPVMLDTGGRKKQSEARYNSIMFYEDAILDAILDLKDGHNGSCVTSIKKHVQSNFLQYDDEEPEPDMPLEDSTFLFWKDSLFVQALKSLVRQESLIHSTCIKNGSTFYKLSSNYKQHRTKELNDRLQNFERYKTLQHQKKLEAMKRKEVPVGKPSFKKGHLVEAKTVTIVDKHLKNSMDLDLEQQREKRFVLPRHELDLRADDFEDMNHLQADVNFAGRTHKSLREKFRIPHTKILVKDV